MVTKPMKEKLSVGDLIVHVRNNVGPGDQGKLGEKGIVKDFRNTSRNRCIYMSISDAVHGINTRGVVGDRYRHGYNNWIYKAARFELDDEILSYNAYSSVEDWKDKASEIRHKYSDEKFSQLFLKFHREQFALSSFRIWKITEDQLFEEELKLYKYLKNHLDNNL